MNLDEIENRINSIFDEAYHRQIIFWYDENQEFREDIENINLKNAKLHILKDNNLIQTKYKIEFEDKESNYLIYAPFGQPNDNENYLADLTHYAVPFSADKIEMTAQSLNIPSEFNNLLKKYSSFWNAKSRVNAFNDLNISYTELNIRQAILAVLSNQKTLNFDYIVREVIINNFSEENKIIKNFEKFNIIDDFWELISLKFFYSEENPSVSRLVRSLILNYTANLYQGSTPKSWEEYLVSDKNNSSIFISEFMNNAHYSDYYDKIAKSLEPKLNITSLSKSSIDAYVKCDSFERFDENIINHYVELLFENQVDLGSEFRTILEDRKKTHFYQKYENYYEVLKYANLFISLTNEFMRFELPEEVEEIIKSYAEKWVYLDSYYRKFYYFYDSLEDTENLENLRQLIENLYVNKFLSVINPKFTKKLAEKPISEIDIPKQWKFFKQNIPASIRKHKTAVIISDAFRYGCAVELFAELEKDPTRTPKIQPMLSSIPSYTALGMASLLPNKEIAYDGNVILVDGMKCNDINERNNVLNSNVNDVLAVKYEDINKLKAVEFRELMKGCNLVYVYHDKIDARGDHPPSENEVFNAAQETISDLESLIKTLRDQGNFAKIYITADHGFIYKRDKLEEHEKVSLDSFSEKRHKRFILSDEPLDIDGSVALNMEYLGMDKYVNVPIGADVFKAPGAGINYVHGGASLEECIIPLLEVKADKGAKRQRTVELQLLQTKYKITNHDVMLTFFQKENISQDVLPLEASVYFVDEDNNKISGETIIFADKQSDSSQDREFKEHFRLLQKKYDKSKNYYLIIRDLNEDLEVDRIPFTIDIPFQDGFDFF
ncbi:MAG: BREX-1 system phosphatase PglZ type A [Methanobrevibacter sp.]|uniref:BREX-1 system phosphatase PglZ type A n=1 Tax=Methanobrevibacter sp. TaxID=66852 RepID=UPI0025F7ACA5|nr:BREX-1 system phosphatase PglZ type A [Methanobrevibacter sp.]MBR3112544.1 BREX-1 system phosphatase PglZ type A [Methanobrevibacter sp.]